MPSIPLLLIWPLFVALGAAPAVAISVYPLVGMAPNTFRVRVIIPRHADNRGLCLSYAGPEWKRSCMGLEGDQAGSTFTKYWFMRVPGAYDAVADLSRVTGQHLVARQTFEVLGGF